MRLNINGVCCLIFLLLGFLLTIPAFHQGLIVSDDILVYSNWHRCFSEQLIAGEWYPRWLMDMNGGRGSPVFFFYPPLPFYVSALFDYFVPNGSPAWYALYLSFGLALGLSGMTSFYLLKLHTQTWSAFLLALFYMLAPYHLFINFYHRFAYPEFWAMTWLPLVFYFLEKSLNDNKNYNIGLATFFALLIITHIPTFIITSAIISFYIFAKYINNIRIINSVNSVIIGFIFSSFYIIPMLSYKRYISLNEMWAGRYSIFNNLISFNNYFSNNYYFKIAIINLIILLIISISTYKTKNKEIRFWLIIGIFSIFLMFKISGPIWKILPILQIIQFPWRLNVISLISILVSSAILFNRGNRNIAKKDVFFKSVIIFMLLTQVFTVFMQLNYLEETKISLAEETRATQETKVKLGVIEYLPRWTSEGIFSGMKARSLESVGPKFSTSPAGELSISRWQPREIELTASSDAGFTATLNQFYFPLWQITSDKKGSPFMATPSSEGYVQFDVPPGEHTITAKLVEGPAETAGRILSFLAISLTALSCIWNRFSLSTRAEDEA
jgi:hypothetical protein